MVCASTADLATLRALLHHNCCLTTKGNVYKRRRKVEYVLDAFELAYTEGYLHTCRLMVEAGYCVYRLRDAFLRDFQRQSSDLQEPAQTHPHPAAASDQSGTKAEVMQLTFAHAHKLPDDWLEILLWLIAKASNARSLKEHAVFVVRATIGHRLLCCVDSLPLPKLVKDYVLLKNLGLDEPSGQYHSLFDISKYFASP